MPDIPQKRDRDVPKLHIMRDHYHAENDETYTDGQALFRYIVDSWPNVAEKAINHLNTLGITHESNIDEIRAILNSAQRISGLTPVRIQVLIDLCTETAKRSEPQGFGYSTEAPTIFGDLRGLIEDLLGKCARIGNLFSQSGEIKTNTAPLTIVTPKDLAKAKELTINGKQILKLADRREFGEGTNADTLRKFGVREDMDPNDIIEALQKTRSMDVKENRVITAVIDFVKIQCGID
ncbi:hypothetical protein KKF73_00675 [Patescibacteria group bacterium]|nr:hypothetical protein [Patescibacteria group bacterium]